MKINNEFLIKLKDWVSGLKDGEECRLPDFMKDEFDEKFDSIKLVNEIIALSDRIEAENETEFNEWRAFKHFRNTLRDKYILND